MISSAAQQLAEADLASPVLGFGAILVLSWPGGLARGRWAENLTCALERVKGLGLQSGIVRK